MSWLSASSVSAARRTRRPRLVARGGGEQVRQPAGLRRGPGRRRRRRGGDREPGAAGAARRLARSCAGTRTNGARSAGAPIRGERPRRRGRDGLGDAARAPSPRRSGSICARASRERAAPDAARPRRRSAPTGSATSKSPPEFDTSAASSFSARIWSETTRRIASAVSLVSCGRSRTPRRSSARVCVEFALDLARHVLHLRDRLAEPVRGVIERAGQLGVGLIDGRLQRLGGSLALLGRRVANGFELAGDRDRGACASRRRARR